MRVLLAALLLPGLAMADCYTHPDTGATYCAAANECPAGTAWVQQTSECKPGTPPIEPQTCRIIVEYTTDPRAPLVYPLDGRYCSTEDVTDALIAALARFRGI